MVPGAGRCISREGVINYINEQTVYFVPQRKLLLQISGLLGMLVKEAGQKQGNFL